MDLSLTLPPARALRPLIYIQPSKHPWRALALFHVEPAFSHSPSMDDNCLSTSFFFAFPLFNHRHLMDPCEKCIQPWICIRQEAMSDCYLFTDSVPAWFVLLFYTPLPADPQRKVAHMELRRIDADTDGAVAYGVQSALSCLLDRALALPVGLFELTSHTVTGPELSTSFVLHDVPSSFSKYLKSSSASQRIPFSDTLSSQVTHYTKKHSPSFKDQSFYQLRLLTVNHILISTLRQHHPT